MRRGIIRRNPNAGITQAPRHTMGQRINASHTTQRPNPFGVAYDAANSYGAANYGCGKEAPQIDKMQNHLVDKQTLILMMLAFGLGYLLFKK